MDGYKPYERKDDGIVLPPQVIEVGGPVGARPDSSSYDNPRPHGLLPRSKLFIPQASGKKPAELTEEKCKHVPRNQYWAVGWIDKVPREPGGLYENFTLVILDVFATEARAQKRREKVFRKYPNRHCIVFRLGYWLNLPIPFWLSAEDEIIEHNHNITSGLIAEHQRAMEIKHEVLRRRTERAKLDKGDYMTVDEENKVLYEKYDHTDHADHTDQRDDTEETDDMETSWETASKPQAPSWRTPVHLTSKRLKYCLLWVLPDVQTPRLKFSNISFNLLGAYSRLEELEPAESLIRKSHPEWSIYCCELGHPIEMPVPVWLMKDPQQNQFEQPGIDHMLKPSEYVGPAEMEEKLKTAEAPTVSPEVEHIVEQLAGERPALEEKAEEPPGPVLTQTQSATRDKSITMVATQHGPEESQ